MGRAFDYSKFENWIDPTEVQPYPRNAKMHPPEQIERIAASIDRFGWQQDTVITADNVLVIGHGRRLAALKLGCKMPFHRVGKNADELTDAEIKALRLADNRTSESEIDFGKLELELDSLKDFGMGSFGFTVNTGFAQVEEPFAGDAGDNEYGDAGFREYQEPLTNEELEYYSQSAEELLIKRRVIVTFGAEQEEDVRRLLGVEQGRLHVVYDIEELVDG